MTLTERQFNELLVVLEPYLNEDLDCEWRDRYFRLCEEYETVYTRSFQRINELQSGMADLQERNNQQLVRIRYLELEDYMWEACMSLDGI